MPDQEQGQAGETVRTIFAHDEAMVASDVAAEIVNNVRQR